MTTKKKQAYTGSGKAPHSLGRVPQVLDMERTIKIVVLVDGKETPKIAPYEHKLSPTAVVARINVADALEECAKQIREGRAFEIRGE